jgi:hypothetical protein
MNKEGNRRERRRKLSLNLIFKLSWALWKSASCCVCVYLSSVCMFQRRYSSTVRERNSRNVHECRVPCQAGTCRKDMEHGNPARTFKECGMDIRNGHLAQTCSIDIQHAHAALTFSIYMQYGHIDVRTHTCTCTRTCTNMHTFFHTCMYIYT